MKSFSTPAKIAVKILEVGHWVVTALMSIAAVLSLAAPEYLKYVMDVDSLLAGEEVSSYGFAYQAVAGSADRGYLALFLFCLGSVAIFTLMALVFRKLYQIIKRSEKQSPFHRDNIRQLKWIGRLCIFVPLVGFVMSVLVRLVVGADAAEISMDQSLLIMGIIVFCLTEYFTYGAKLEEDMEGLV